MEQEAVENTAKLDFLRDFSDKIIAIIARPGLHIDCLVDGLHNVIYHCGLSSKAIAHAKAMAMRGRVYNTDEWHRDFLWEVNMGYPLPADSVRPNLSYGQIKPDIFPSDEYGMSRIKISNFPQDLEELVKMIRNPAKQTVGFAIKESPDSQSYEVYLCVRGT